MFRPKDSIFVKVWVVSAMAPFTPYPTPHPLPPHPEFFNVPQIMLINRTRSDTEPTVNKQLLDEVEHDIMNYQNRGLCYLPKPKAEADN